MRNFRFTILLQDRNKGQTPDILYREIGIKPGILYSNKSKQPEVKLKLLITTLIILHQLYHWHSTVIGTWATKFYLSMLKPNHDLGFSLGKFHFHFNSSKLSWQQLSVQIFQEDLSLLGWNPTIKFYFTPPEQDINMLHQ